MRHRILDPDRIYSFGLAMKGYQKRRRDANNMAMEASMASKRAKGETPQEGASGDLAHVKKSREVLGRAY